MTAPADRSWRSCLLTAGRLMEIKSSHDVSIEFSLDGPYTIDIDEAIAIAAASGRFIVSPDS